MHIPKMSGRIFGWTNAFVCVVAILGDWTAAGIGVQHHKLIRQDEYRSTNDGETINTAAVEDGYPAVPVKVSSFEVEESLPPANNDGNEVNPSNPSVYLTKGGFTGVENGVVEGENNGPDVVATRYNFDKRGTSSYKLKYGGLGKRKLSSNSLRYGGLGKRLDKNERASENEVQERELGNGKNLLDTAYLLLDKPYPVGKNLDDAVDDFPAPNETAYDTPVDHPEMPMLAVREQRSRKGSGMRYAGLGKRRIKV